MPTFYLLVLFLEKSGRCGATSLTFLKETSEKRSRPVQKSSGVLCDSLIKSNQPRHCDCHYECQVPTRSDLPRWPAGRGQSEASNLPSIATRIPHHVISVQTSNKHGLKRKQNTRRHGNNVSHEKKKTLLNDRDERKSKTNQNRSEKNKDKRHAQGRYKSKPRGRAKASMAVVYFHTRLMSPMSSILIFSQ